MDPMQPPMGMPGVPGADDVPSQAFPELDEDGLEAPREEDDPDEDEFDTETDYSDREHLAEKLDKTYERIRKGFQDRKEQLDAIQRYWDCYNGILNDNQAYNG